MALCGPVCTKEERIIRVLKKETFILKTGLSVPYKAHFR
jgi:hypothetical protein